MVFAGERGSGKTAIAVKLVNQYSCMLLTDETVCIHRRTDVVEPFPRAMGIWKSAVDGSFHKVLVPANIACRNLASRSSRVGAVIFLDRESSNAGPELEPVGSGKAFEHLLNHQLDLACEPDEAMCTLAMLAKNVPAAKLTYNRYEDLDAAIESTLSFLGF